jgi:hypothetical protein
MITPSFGVGVFTRCEALAWGRSRGRVAADLFESGVGVGACFILGVVCCF